MSVHPKALGDPDIAAAVDRAIGRLRYGTVLLNMFPYYSACFMVAAWGAFPGHTIYDVQSGTGTTFNSIMLERPEKSVVQVPFKTLDPFTVRSKLALAFCKRVAEFEAAPTWWNLPGLILTALQG